MAGAPILVVDDAPINLRLMRLLLTHEGYDVRTAGCAEDAVEMLSNYKPDLILADIQLPGMSGLEMARKVKENPRTSAIRVVALTACNMNEDREDALRAGCEDYITKPIDTSALAAKVRDLLARPQPKPTSRIQTVPTGEVLSLTGPEVESLRRRFLSEGVERSHQLFNSLGSSFDSAATAGQLHKWAGSAALLGHPEIGAMARRGEELLRREVMDLVALREVLIELYVTFAELRDSSALPFPETLVEETKGKRVALIGFASEPANAMCEMVERMKALPLLFDARDASAYEAIHNCELAVFHVRKETLASPWLQTGGEAPTAKKLVFMGDLTDLVAIAPEVRMRAADVLMDRGDPEEIQMRLAFAVADRRTAAPPPAPAPSAPAGRGRTAIASPNVVLADDDNIILALTSSALQNHGMSCHKADNGLDALKLIRAQQPHVAVLDVNMPGMSGFEVLAAVRAEKIPCRVILLTALQQEDEILRGFRLGADDYLTKPFSPFELVARLKRFLM